MFITKTLIRQLNWVKKRKKVWCPVMWWSYKYWKWNILFLYRTFLLLNAYLWVVWSRINNFFSYQHIHNFITHLASCLDLKLYIYTRSICFTVDIPMCLSHARTHWHRMENAHSAGLRCHRPHCSTGAGTLGVWQAEKGRREESKKYCCFI